MNGRTVLLIAGSVFGIAVALNALFRSIYSNPFYVIPAYGWYRTRFPVNRYHSHNPTWRYWRSTVHEVSSGKFRGPYAFVVGTVRYVVTNTDDDDHHVGVGDEEGNVLVTEIVPELPLTLPSLREHIKIWGVVRFDRRHQWWELHPVMGWERLELDEYRRAIRINAEP